MGKYNKTLFSHKLLNVRSVCQQKSVFCAELPARAWIPLKRQLNLNLYTRTL